MAKRYPQDQHFTGHDSSGREWVDGIPLSTDDEVAQARAFKASIEAQVAAKMDEHLKWRKKHNIVLEHPDDGWVYRPWAAHPLYDYNGDKFGMASGNGPTQHHPEFEQYGMIQPVYPKFVAETIGYGDRICLGHWGTERFMKIVAVLDCNNDHRGVVVSCKENPVRWRIPPPRGPHGLCIYKIVFASDPEYPNYFAEKRGPGHENSIAADFEETGIPTDRPFPDKYWARNHREGPGCFGMIMIVFTLIFLLDKLFS